MTMLQSPCYIRLTSHNPTWQSVENPQDAVQLTGSA